MTKRIDDALAYARARLAAVSDSARLDSEVLLSFVLSQSRTYLYTWPEKTLTADQLAQFESLLEKRQQGHPIAHLTQEREFWGLSFVVSPATLIPRPDTELLVAETLARLSAEQPKRVLDLGTGTGAIACAIASERPNWQILAIDRVDEAVTLAQHNVRQLQLDNVEVKQGSWFSGLSAETDNFDAIISNPPYIDAADEHLSQGDVRFEPTSALISDNNGLADIEEIVANAKPFLLKTGMLLIEHGWQQGDSVKSIFIGHGFTRVSLLRDLSGNPRATLGYRD